MNQMTRASQTPKLVKRRMLLLANETLESATVCEVISLGTASAEPPAQLLVVAPALNSRIRHWMSDVDGARRSASLRLSACLDRLGAAGIEAKGMVGDPDPLQAIADALQEFDAQELVIATRADGRSHWLTRGLIGRACKRFAQPVMRFVVEPNEGATLDSQPTTTARVASVERVTSSARFPFPNGVRWTVEVNPCTGGSA